MRVRNAKIGIHTKASGVDFAFVNSNSFYHGAVSGGGFDYGVRRWLLVSLRFDTHVQYLTVPGVDHTTVQILVEGPGPNNNNIFIGVCRGCEPSLFRGGIRPCG